VIDGAGASFRFSLARNPSPATERLPQYIEEIEGLKELEEIASISLRERSR